jgi:hypothetical protein
MENISKAVEQQYRWRTTVKLDNSSKLLTNGKAGEQ